MFVSDNILAARLGFAALLSFHALVNKKIKKYLDEQMEVIVVAS